MVEEGTKRICLKVCVKRSLIEQFQIPYNGSMSTEIEKPAKQTYFGVISLFGSIFSVVFLAAFFGVSQLRISPATFSFWNNIIGSIYCLITPFAFVLAILAWRRKKDSKLMAGIAMSVIGVPFLVLFTQFISAVFP